MVVIEQVSKHELIDTYNFTLESKEEIENEFYMFASEENIYYAYKYTHEFKNERIREFSNINDCMKYLEGVIKIPSENWYAYNIAKEKDPTILYYTDYIRSEELYFHL